MRKTLNLLFVIFISMLACTSTHSNRVHKNDFIELPLPAELADANQQFSGLCIANNKLYLLPECRLQENQAAAIYAIPLSEINNAINGDSTPVSFDRITVRGLGLLREKMRSIHQQYEGTESIIIHGTDVYFSVETATTSANCYLLKGKLNNNQVDLDTSIMFPLRKPTAAGGKKIYNAGFETMLLRQQKLYCFFEYNSFESGSYVYVIDSSLRNSNIDSVSISNIPFRITDATLTPGGNATAINYFYKGEGDDAVYRPLPSDTAYRLVHDSTGFFNYNRLISLHFLKGKISYDVVSEMPAQYWSYNWEGIAAYNGGYFMINDKYTGKRPYKSVLLYIRH